MWRKKNHYSRKLDKLSVFLIYRFSGKKFPLQ